MLLEIRAQFGYDDITSTEDLLPALTMSALLMTTTML
jgi:hypothetical protein